MLIILCNSYFERVSYFGIDVRYVDKYTDSHK